MLRPRCVWENLNQRRVWSNVWSFGYSGGLHIAEARLQPYQRRDGGRLGAQNAGSQSGSRIPRDPKSLEFIGGEAALPITFDF